MRYSKGARLYLRPATKSRAATWVIRDGEHEHRTGLGQSERAAAQERLDAYLADKYRPDRSGGRHPSQIEISDVIDIYLADVAPLTARPDEVGQRALKLLDFFGDKKLSAINGGLCRQYAKHRGSQSMARRELEDLRAAIKHHRKEGLCSEIIEVVLPPKSEPRERWLTRSEAARLIWHAWKYRESQKGFRTDRASRKHIARFILVALYTGTRAGAVCAASPTRVVGRSYIDLEKGIFYRRAIEAKVTKKRQPAVRLPDELLAHLRRWHRKGIAKQAFVEFNGKPIASVRKAFARVAEDAEVADVSPHTLRHTAVTWAMQGGADLWEAAGYFGMTVEVLERVYGHHHPNHGKSVAAAIRRKA